MPSLSCTSLKSFNKTWQYNSFDDNFIKCQWLAINFQIPNVPDTKLRLLPSLPIVNKKDPKVRRATVPVALLQYWSSRSFKVDDLHLIWKGVCDFILVINSNLSTISHRLATIHPWRTDRRQRCQLGRRTAMLYGVPIGNWRPNWL